MLYDNCREAKKIRVELITEKSFNCDMECPHLDRVIRQGQGGGGTVPSWPSLTDPSVKLECGECRATESVWICVTCSALNCGRYIKAHGLMHKVRIYMSMPREY